MTSSLRIAIVTDIHHGKDHFTKKGSAALPLMAEFARFVADAKPNLVVDLGDRISDCSRETDLVLEREVAEAFAPIAVPHVHLCGNHDREHLTVAENEEILGEPLGHRTFDIGGWRLVLWAADTLLRQPGGFVLIEADLLWLAAAVRAADRPLAIMSHVPVSGHAQTGNYYFERNPGLSTYPGAERVRAVLRGAAVPVVWISGHVHWTTINQVDGIPHFTLQSLTETYSTHPEPSGAYALLELDDTIGFTAHGLEPMAVRLSTAAAARRWITPLPPFDEVPPQLRARHFARAVE
jgi:hypothetical protein